MTSVLIPEQCPPGFVFDNIQRNTFLQKQTGLSLPQATKTGTTICGIVFKDGVVLGADTRATGDTIVADKNCSKIHYLAKNMYFCGAGTAADTEVTSQMIASQLELHRLNTGREVPVVTANRMVKQLLYRYQGFIGAALVLAGVDSTGPHLYSIYPHGSTDILPYTSMGSGSLAAMAVLESGWTPDLDEESAKILVHDAIKAGVLNDLGSGNTIDLCVIKKGTVDYLRPYKIIGVKGKRQGSYEYKVGTTPILSCIVRPIIIDDEQIKPVELESMDTL